MAGWPLGLAKVSWRYGWRTTPVHRTEVDGDDSDLPGPVPAEAFDDDIQPVCDGHGPMLHRRYSVAISGTRATPEEVIANFAGEPNRGTPPDAAVFEKTRGEHGVLAVGDEFLIRMPGPWNGPVRVIGRSPASFRFATLRGHLEAGQIEFRARAGGPGDGGAGLVFEIESWARPGDRLSHLLYNRLLLAKEIQLNLWVETCLRLAAGTGGRARDGVRVHTRRVARPPDARVRS